MKAARYMKHNKGKEKTEVEIQEADKKERARIQLLDRAKAFRKRTKLKTKLYVANQDKFATGIMKAIEFIFKPNPNPNPSYNGRHLKWIHITLLFYLWLRVE